jgi:predicted phosphodiesterase
MKAAINASMNASKKTPLRLLVFGHSHRPELEWQGACLLLNPGACGPRRFSYPLTLAIVTIAEGRLVPEILAVGPVP